MPDTTLRDVLCTVDPQTLRSSLHAVVHQAERRKALDPSELPFGVVSLDGKAFSISASDDWYAQRQTSSEQGPLVGVVRSVTATLTSHPARPVIDVFPIPAHTNEMGVFESALGALCDAYSGLFRLICYDAGACSAHNAKLVREHGYHYLFALTAAQPTLLHEAKLCHRPGTFRRRVVVTQITTRASRCSRRAGDPLGEGATTAITEDTEATSSSRTCAWVDAFP